MANQVITSSKSSNSKKEFNVWNNLYYKLGRAYFECGKKDTFKVVVRYYEDVPYDFKSKETGKQVKFTAEGSKKVFNYLERNGALNVVSFKGIKIKGKVFYEVEVEDFKIKAELPCKEGDKTWMPFKRGYQDAQFDAE